VAKGAPIGAIYGDGYGVCIHIHSIALADDASKRLKYLFQMCSRNHCSTIIFR
jgi:hypothetical protein